VLVDGPPGIGCPAIASVTGATGVLVVTEPTVSGEHDLARVLVLCRHFALPVAVCVNRWDINPGTGERIEGLARERGAACAGRIPYDRAVTAAQLDARTVVEVGGPAADAIRDVWQRWNTAIDHG
jgi:MinD superfamily P-loop ATPase